MPSTAATIQRRAIQARARWRRLPKQLDLADAINVLVVDNDPTVRSSLQAILAVEPGIGKVDSAPSSGVAIKRVIARRPHVCLIGYHVGADAGFLLTRRIKRLKRAPKVIVYGSSLDAMAAGAARVAGADGVILSPPSPHELGQIIRRVAAGEKQLPTVPPTALRALAARLDPPDRPILTMLVSGTPPAEVAAVLGLSREQLSTRRWAILDRLRQSPGEPLTAREPSGEDNAATAAPTRRSTMPPARVGAATNSNDAEPRPANR